MRRKLSLTWAFITVFGLYGPVVCNAATLTDFGTLGGTNSYAYGVSGDGSVIVGNTNVSLGGAVIRAFKFSSTAMTFDIGTLGGTVSYARGVSADGTVIVGGSLITGDAGTHAFKYIGATMTDLGTLGGTYSAAFAVSADGSVIVGESSIAGNAAVHAFKYIGTTMTDLLTLGGTYSEANAVSADGSVIVGVSNLAGNLVSRAFKYTGTTMTDLGTLGGTNSQANAVSADGSVIVGESMIDGSPALHAFKYTGTTMTDLGTLGGTNSYAYGVSGDGSVIVGASDLSGDTTSHAFIYRSVIVDANNTVAAITNNMGQLESVFNMKAALLANALDSDCSLYSDKGICAALSGWHYSGQETGLAAQTASTFKASYRFSDNFRAGLLMDLAFAQTTPDNFSAAKAPLFGAFAAYGDNAGGPQIKLAVAYNSADTEITRTVMANTEAGKGDSNIKSLGAKAELAYGLADFHGWTLNPYAAIRYSNISRGGYAEASGATFPVVYDKAALKQFTTLLAMGAKRSLSSNVGLALNAGLAQDLGKSMDDYSGTMDTLGAFKVTASEIAATRPFASVGLGYTLAKDRRLNFDIGSMRLPFGKTYGVIATARYMVAF